MATVAKNKKEYKDDFAFSGKSSDNRTQNKEVYQHRAERMHKNQKQTASLIARAEKEGCLSEQQATLIRRFESVKRIDEWAMNGLIDAKQRQRLYRLAGVPQTGLKKSTSADVTNRAEQGTLLAEKTKIWAKRMSLFAVLCIILGVVAVISANWQGIPDTVKLGGYFIGFTALIGSLFVADAKQKKWVRECLLWGNIGWIFAGLGLIGQIYHLSDSFWNALLAGSILAIPYVLHSQLRVSLPIWMASYGLGAVLGTGGAFVPLWTVAVLPIVLWKRKQAIVSVFWWIAFCGSLMEANWFLTALSDFYDYLMPTACFALTGVVLLGLVGLARRYVGSHTGFTRTLQIIGIVIGILTVIFVDVMYTENGFAKTVVSLTPSFIGLAGGAIAGLGFIGWLVPQGGRRTALQVLFWAFLVSFGYLFVGETIFGMIFTLICLLGLSIFAVHRGNTWLFNLSLLGMIVRVGIAYMGYILSLMSTGIGLIIIGAVLLLGIWVYVKGYPALVRLMKGERLHDSK